jgi:hypothetical protein
MAIKEEIILYLAHPLPMYLTTKWNEIRRVSIANFALYVIVVSSVNNIHVTTIAVFALNT